MDYELYENSTVAALEDSPSHSKSSWNMPSDGSMDNNDEYFDWNPLKIDEETTEPVSGQSTRKRKLPPADTAAPKSRAYQQAKDPLAQDKDKKAQVQNGTF